MFGLAGGSELLRKGETVLFEFHSTVFLASLTSYQDICPKRQKPNLVDHSAKDL